MKHRKLGENVLYIADVTYYLNKCYVCGNIRETRPYGENEQEICHQCAILPEYYDMVDANLRRAVEGKALLIHPSYKIDDTRYNDN